MDEFLALMENDTEPTVEVPIDDEKSDPNENHNENGLDELSALLDDDRPLHSENVENALAPPDNASQSALSSKESSGSDSKKRKSSSSDASATQPTTGVDERLGFRMINRQVSSLDLLDMITLSPFVSPAKMNAMSLSALCAMLVDPPSIIDPATVTGRTQAITVGIIFENSGTKTSSKGGAFCILKIGSLQSGPCLSIFLFGSAYSKYCRNTRAGMVVAIQNPKLLLLKESGHKNDTRISLSIHDPSQLIPVAKARDYGVCKATMKARSADGVWRNNAAPCRHFVDKRVSDYCELHRKQQKNKKATEGSNLFVERKLNKSNVGQRLVPLVQKSEGVKGQNRFNLQPNQGTGGMPASNRFKNQPNNLGGGVPMHMTKERTPVVSRNHPSRVVPSTTPATSTNSLLNGTRKQKPITNQKSAPLAKKPKKATGVVGTGDWLNTATTGRRSASLSLARLAERKGVNRSLNTGGGGFDGSVAVPKASKIFQRQPQMAQAFYERSDTRFTKSSSDIRAKQAELAQVIREHAPIQSGRKPVSKARSHGGAGNTFLDSIKVDDVSAVLAAKSQFADEADAEEYAKSRQRLTELQQLEDKQKKQKGADEKENKRLTTEWSCVTCSARFTTKPKGCFAKRHNVKVCRKVRETLSKEETRTKLHRKDVADGGLVLSRGLDWSQYRKNRFS